MNSTSPTRNLQKWFRENRVFLLFLFCFVLGRSLLLDQNFVPSESMLPSLHVGDMILVDKRAYDIRWPFSSRVMLHLKDPQRGDVIVFENPREGVIMVKRLIGLPGDELHIRNDLIEVNGKTYTPPELSQRFANEGFFTYTEQSATHAYPVQRIPGLLPYGEGYDATFRVPDGHYFMMGDNRDNSLDSRAWGFVPRGYLRGRVLRILYNIRLDGWMPKMDLGRIGQAVP